MKPDRWSWLLIVVVCVLFAQPVCWGQQIYEGTSPLTALAPYGQTSYFNLTLGLRKYLNSFTSWQFPNSRGPQDPLSRLEYPWDQTFVAVRGSASYSSLEFNAEWSGTLNVASNPKAQDSDWTFGDLPNQKTLFDEAEANPRSWILDFSCNMALLPSLSPARGVLGYRTSNFKFTYGNGYFNSIDPGYVSGPEYGARIEFIQNYQHLYAGAILGTVIHGSELFRRVQLPPMSLRLQADASYVIGKNHDDHVVRPYIYQSYLRTDGFGWHINLCAGVRTGRVKFEIEGDVRGVNTRGVMEDLDGSSGVVVTKYIEGAKAWSEQKYLGVSGTLFF